MSLKKALSDFSQLHPFLHSSLPQQIGREKTSLWPYHALITSAIDDVHHIFSTRSEKKKEMKLFDDMIADLVSRSLHSLLREISSVSSTFSHSFSYDESRKVVYAWTLPSRVNCVVSALALATSVAMNSPNNSTARHVSLCIGSDNTSRQRRAQCVSFSYADECGFLASRRSCISTLDTTQKFHLRLILAVIGNWSSCAIINSWGKPQIKYCNQCKSIALTIGWNISPYNVRVRGGGSTNRIKCRQRSSWSRIESVFLAIEAAAVG